jgi:hypothetical protein
MGIESRTWSRKWFIGMKLTELHNWAVVDAYIFWEQLFEYYVIK